jgi:hypothetical protein
MVLSAPVSDHRRYPMPVATTQLKSHDPKRGKKLGLQRETIRNLRPNAAWVKAAAFPSATSEHCLPSDDCEPTYDCDTVIDAAQIAQ